jgi:hypothetical protein
MRAETRCLGRAETEMDVLPGLTWELIEDWVKIERRLRWRYSLGAKTDVRVY